MDTQFPRNADNGLVAPPAPPQPSLPAMPSMPSLQPMSPVGLTPVGGATAEAPNAPATSHTPEPPRPQLWASPGAPTPPQPSPGSQTYGAQVHLHTADSSPSRRGWLWGGGIGGTYLAIRLIVLVMRLCFTPYSHSDDSSTNTASDNAPAPVASAPVYAAPAPVVMTAPTTYSRPMTGGVPSVNYGGRPYGGNPTAFNGNPGNSPLAQAQQVEEFNARNAQMQAMREQTAQMQRETQMRMQQAQQQAQQDAAANVARMQSQAAGNAAMPGMTAGAQNAAPTAPFGNTGGMPQGQSGQFAAQNSGTPTGN